jgi:hypothetical protein
LSRLLLGGENVSMCLPTTGLITARARIATAKAQKRARTPFWYEADVGERAACMIVFVGFGPRGRILLQRADSQASSTWKSWQGGRRLGDGEETR